MAIAVLDYAAGNKGAYPVGTRGDNSADSLTWTSSAVADYFMQYFQGSQFTFESLSNYPELGKALSCNSVYQSLPVVNSASLQPNPFYATGCIALGWDYFGGRLLNKSSDYAPGGNRTDTFKLTMLNNRWYVDVIYRWKRPFCSETGARCHFGTILVVLR